MCGIYSLSYIPFIKEVDKQLKSSNKIGKKNNNVVSEKIFGKDIDEFLKPFIKE